MREVARLTRSRERENLALTVAPPALALAALHVLGELPVELAAAATIGAGLVVLYAASIAAPEGKAASGIDRELGARDAFLTLATVEAEPAGKLRALVEHGAAALGAGVSAARFVPPRARRRIAQSVLLSLLLFVALASLPALQPTVDPAGRLEEIAARLAEGADARDQELAGALRELARALGDPALSREEKRSALKEAQKKLEAESQGQGRSSSGKGKQQGGSGQGEGERSKSAAQAGGTGSSQGARAEAKGELERLAAELGGNAGGETQQEKGQGEKRQGGGIQGPEKPEGAKQREGEGEGNRPAQTKGERNQSSNQPGSGQQGGGREQERSQGPGEAQRAEGQQPKPPGGAGASAGRPLEGQDDSTPAERFYKPGEGPDGWRIENGRYVRVRIPEDSPDAAATETVRKPGIVDPGTPYGNAPLPSSGAPGAVRDTQPLPLEYRAILGEARREQKEGGVR